MKRKQRIESILLNFFNEWRVEVIDNSEEHRGHNNFDGNQESHFKLILTNNKKIKPNILSIHRKINSLLEKEFVTGLHALEIKIL